MAQNNPLTMILGGMFIDSAFRAAMIEDVAAALDAYDIELTGIQHESACAMVASFASGDFEESIEVVDDNCPNWPCPSFMLALPVSQRRGGKGKKKAVKARPKARKAVKGKKPARRR
jgi:hypothetical protein